MPRRRSHPSKADYFPAGGKPVVLEFPGQCPAAAAVYIYASRILAPHIEAYRRPIRSRTTLPSPDGANCLILVGVAGTIATDGTAAPPSDQGTG